MKNQTTKFVGFIALVFAMLTGLSAKAAACPLIKNDMNCPITVQVDIYSSCGGSPVICATYNMTIPAYNSVAIPCSCGFCDIRVTVQTVSGNPVPPTATALMGTAAPGNSFSVISMCATGATANIYYDGTYTEFFIQ